MTIKRSAHKKPGTHIRRGSVTRSMTMKACAALGGWLLLGPAQLTSADDQPGVWWGDVTHQVLPTSNGNMVQVNWAVTLICPTGCEDEPPSFVGIRVKAFDCTGDEVYSEERPISLDCGASAAGMYYFDIPYAPECHRIANTYTVEVSPGECVYSDCDCEEDWEYAVPAGGDLPWPDRSEFDCDTDLTGHCWLCSSSGSFPSASINVFKSKDPSEAYYTLYTLATSDATGALHGEAINGEFIPPAYGRLIVRIEESSPAAKFYGSGWITPSGQQGTEVSSCMAVPPVSRFKFNVVSGISDKESELRVSLHWIWKNCSDLDSCFQYDTEVEETLIFRIKPMPCLCDRDEFVPFRMQRTDRRKSDQTLDIEMRRPCCPSCLPGRKKCDHPKATLTGRFIAWPVLDGAVIKDGHAKGWELQGSKLISPGPASEVFEF